MAHINSCTLCFINTSIQGIIFLLEGVVTQPLVLICTVPVSSKLSALKNNHDLLFHYFPPACYSSSITNVDISDTVIQQMTIQYKKSHPKMKFVAMDLLQMTFEAESFTCFLDKGTLDALMSDTNQESKERAQKMFKVFIHQSVFY